MNFDEFLATPRQSAKGFDPDNWLRETTASYQTYLEGQHVLWRADSGAYDEGSFDVKIYLTAYRVVGYTPCGVWIEKHYTDKRFVNLRNEGGRKWAYPTKDEAIAALYYRKRRQLQIIAYQEQMAKNTINLIRAKGYIK